MDVREVPIQQSIKPDRAAQWRARKGSRRAAGPGMPRRSILELIAVPALREKGGIVGNAEYLPHGLMLVVGPESVKNSAVPSRMVSASSVFFGADQSQDLVVAEAVITTGAADI